jgi:hypothetical protein
MGSSRERPHPTAAVRAGEHGDREGTLEALVDNVTSVAHWLEQKRSP